MVTLRITSGEINPWGFVWGATIATDSKIYWFAVQPNCCKSPWILSFQHIWNYLIDPYLQVPSTRPEKYQRNGEMECFKYLSPKPLGQSQGGNYLAWPFEPLWCSAPEKFTWIFAAVQKDHCIQKVVPISVQILDEIVINVSLATRLQIAWMA